MIPDPRCYYDSPACEGALWECQTCHEYFCETHAHATELGVNVECAACEGERLDNEDDEEDQ